MRERESERERGEYERERERAREREGDRKRERKEDTGVTCPAAPDQGRCRVVFSGSTLGRRSVGGQFPPGEPPGGREPWGQYLPKTQWSKKEPPPFPFFPILSRGRE